MAPPVADQLDIAAKAFWALPWEERDAAFTRLRRDEPVSWSRPAESDLLPAELNTDGFWSLTTYEDVRFASRHPELFSSAQGITMETFPAQIRGTAGSFIVLDAPRHTQLRGVTLQAFTPRNMLRMAEWVRGHARDLVDEMAHLGGGDFVELVSVQLPGRIFSSLFGLHEGEMQRKTVAAAQRLLSWTDPEVCGRETPLELWGHAVAELHEVAAELAEERRAAPGDDLFSWMIRAEWEGERMSDAEICSFFSLLAIAANDTTRHASAHAIHALSRFPDQRALLLADLPGRLDGAVEEILRWSSVLIHMRRTATQDVEVGGRRIRAGDKVVLWYCSSNRDESYWTDPFTFDITRSPNRHQAFGGGGPHYCLGAALARQMLRAVLSEVYTRIPDIDAAHPDFLVANFIHGIKRLPAEWTSEAVTCPSRR